MKKRLQFLLLVLLPLLSAAQSHEKKLLETVNEYLKQYTIPHYRPTGKMKADSVRANTKERTLAVYTNEAFYSQLFTPQSVKTVYQQLSEYLPRPFNSYRLTIYGRNGKTIEELIPEFMRESNSAHNLHWGNTRFTGNPWVENVSKPYNITRGLEGRHLMIWPSHGRFNKFGIWKWQRPYLFCTTEDLLTQSFVLPYLYPMLENAGAIVCSPRERDMQSAEAVVDNDAPGRKGTYNELSQPDFAWRNAPDSAFAPPTGWLTDSILPFRLGTARIIHTTSRKSRLSTATWTPHIPSSGRYAVYVSYPSLPNSVSDAHYTVYHKGGRTNFRVNQQIGGGTWVYLGTFHFDKGENQEGRVVLNNQSDYRGVVGADGVRFGGGMGQTERAESGTSNMPRYLEAARYHTQWSGLADTLFNSADGNDYVDDLRSRSYLLNHIGGGSPYMPHLKGLGVPLELSLALHTDAGIRPNDSIYGSLAIFTSTDREGEREYSSKLSRLSSSELAARLLTTIVTDISKTFGTDWTLRELWDRNYSETRSPAVPSAILEMLSHQNFADMKFAHDPIFKFHLMRSVYKAVLEYVGASHRLKERDVQPLPIGNFSALLSDNENSVRLSWTPTADPLERSAHPKAYILYTRTEDTAYDNGQLIEGHTSVSLPIHVGKQYCFKITAINDGGESFPSEELTVYKAPNANSKQVLLVNAFRRLSGPARIEKGDSVGFDLRADFGVPYLYTSAICGAQRNFNLPLAGGEGPESWGFSGNELEGRTIAGNTFDYPTSHGKAIAAAGKWSFSSCSRDAVISGDVSLNRFAAIDYITGLERDAPQNLRPFKTFPKKIREQLTKYLHRGAGLLVSGAYIASDMQQNAEERKFIEEVLKYRLAGIDTIPTLQLGADSVSAGPAFNNKLNGLNLSIPLRRTLSDKHYAVQTADVIMPAAPNAFTAFVYAGGLSAGTAYRGKDYRIIAMGFPFECIEDEEVQASSMEALLNFLTE